MTDRFFLDTNILVYANDRSSRRKKKLARSWIGRAFETRSGCLSTQVLQEFFVVATRKASVPPDNARSQILLFRQLDTVIVDEEMILSAVDLHMIHSISFWDALIVRSAGAAGCSTLLTEDLQHGQVLDGIRVVDPFRAG
jgi:predicted nucleic acid-binding protein